MYLETMHFVHIGKRYVQHAWPSDDDRVYVLYPFGFDNAMYKTRLKIIMLKHGLEEDPFSMCQFFFYFMLFSMKITTQYSLHHTTIQNVASVRPSVIHRSCCVHSEYYIMHPLSTTAILKCFLFGEKWCAYKPQPFNIVLLFTDGVYFEKTIEMNYIIRICCVYSLKSAPPLHCI